MVENNYNPFANYNDGKSGTQGIFGQQPMQTVQNHMISPEIALYQHESFLIEQRADAEIRKYQAKRLCDEESIERVLKKKADIKMQQRKMSPSIVIDPDGNITEAQQYFLRGTSSYAITNFKIAEKPVCYRASAKGAGVLRLEVITCNQEARTVYFNLERCEASYYRKQLRKNGLELKRDRGSEDNVLDFIQCACDKAVQLKLPKRRGFFWDDNGVLYYAGKYDLIWREVLEYAR